MAQDWDCAFSWAKRAADKGYPVGLQCLAECYLKGLGTPACHALGIAKLVEAVETSGGTTRAIWMIGWAHIRGQLGFPKDEEESARILKKLNQCTYNNISQEQRDIAEKWLKAHASKRPDPM